MLDAIIEQVSQYVVRFEFNLVEYIRLLYFFS